jgi:hypothetical protein
MRKYLVLSFIIGAYLLSLQTYSYGFALNISPPSLKASVEPGGSTSGSITVQNNSEKDIGILVYTQDWLYNPDGSKTFYAAGTKPFSCAKWIRLFPKKFQLEAGGRMAVQYTINLPENAEGGYYAVIFFESVPTGELEGDEGMMVRFAGRLGTIVYLETKGKSIRKGAIESLSVTPPQSNRPLEMVLSFKNMGNVYIGAKGVLNIIDEEGSVYGKKRFGPVNTLPGDTRETQVEWLGELEEGTYYTVITLDIGTEEPIVEERKIEIVSGGAIESLVVDISSTKPSFSVMIKNTGDLNIDVGGRIEVLKETGEMIQSLNLKKVLIAPGKEKDLKAVLEEKLPQGTYTAKAIVSIGTKELTKEEVFSIE